MVHSARSQCNICILPQNVTLFTISSCYTLPLTCLPKLREANHLRQSTKQLSAAGLANVANGNAAGWQAAVTFFGRDLSSPPNAATFLVEYSFKFHELQDVIHNFRSVPAGLLCFNSCEGLTTNSSTVGVHDWQTVRGLSAAVHQRIWGGGIGAMSPQDGKSFYVQQYS